MIYFAKVLISLPILLLVTLQYVPKAFAEPQVITTITQATHTMTTELIDGVPAHVLVINTPAGNPDYKYQFLTGGIRLYIDRKDTFGWAPLVSQVQTAPEYLRQQGAPGNSTWNPYGLAVSTTGSNIHQGFDRQNQPNGEIHLVRTYNTNEEGVAEVLTETWVVPATTEELAQKGPKVTYSMTKNRGIVLDGGVQEGTWRMRWNISGIADINADSSDIKDANSWPIRKKKYSNGEFAIDVNDFDSQENNINSYSYNEVGANNKAEILFFKNGTTGNRIIDPSIVATSVAVVWPSHRQRAIFYNGENWFVLYSTTGSTILYKSASTIAGLNGASSQSLVSDMETLFGVWAVHVVDDTKLDLVYTSDTTTKNIVTVAISGTTLTPGQTTTETEPSGVADVSIVRNPNADRIWVSEVTDTGKHVVTSADSTGNTTTGMTFTQRHGTGSTILHTSLVTETSSNEVHAIYLNDAGGTNSDGIYASRCQYIVDGCGASTGVRNTSSARAINSDMFGLPVRLSDTDFRVPWINDDNSSRPYQSLVVSSWDGSAWSDTTIESADNHSPSLFLDRLSNPQEMYLFYVDASDDIYRYHYDGSIWTSDTRVDNSEVDANSFPVAAYTDPPPGSSRSSPQEISWCYRNAAVGGYDIVCGNENLVAGGSAPTVTTEAASSIGADSATLNSTVNPNSLQTNVFYKYDTQDVACSSMANTSSNEDIGSGSTNVNPNARSISSLNPSTTYYFCAGATNSVGTTYGEKLNFQTTAQTSGEVRIRGGSRLRGGSTIH